MPSSTPRVIGPNLSSDQHSVIAPVRGTRPYVGRSPVTPQAHARRNNTAARFAADREPYQARGRRRPRYPRSIPTLLLRAAMDSRSAPPNQISFSAKAPMLSFATSNRARFMQTLYHRRVRARHAIPVGLRAIRRRDAGRIE